MECRIMISARLTPIVPVSDALVLCVEKNAHKETMMAVLMDRCV